MEKSQTPRLEKESFSFYNPHLSRIQTTSSWSMSCRPTVRVCCLSQHSLSCACCLAVLSPSLWRSQVNSIFPKATFPRRVDRYTLSTQAHAHRERQICSRLLTQSGRGSFLKKRPRENESQENWMGGGGLHRCCKLHLQRSSFVYFASGVREAEVQ